MPRLAHPLRARPALERTIAHQGRRLRWVADRAQISAQTLLNIRCGSPTSPYVAFRIAQVLEVEVEEIFTRVPPLSVQVGR